MVKKTMPKVLNPLPILDEFTLNVSPELIVAMREVVRYRARVWKWRRRLD